MKHTQHKSRYNISFPCATLQTSIDSEIHQLDCVFVYYTCWKVAANKLSGSMFLQEKKEDAG